MKLSDKLRGNSSRNFGRLPKLTRRLVLGIALLAVAITSGYAVATSILNQTINPPPSKPPALNGSCSTLSTTTTTILTGSSGVIVYTCGGSPAFISIDGASTVTPTITGLQTNFSFGYAVDGANCASPTTLTSGSPTTVPVNSYDYCLSFTSYPSTTPPAININWFQ